MAQRKDPDEIEGMYGTNNFKRWSVSIDSSNKKNVRWNSVDGRD